MGTDDGKTLQATILAGPGLIRQPGAVADGLDRKLKEIVSVLEKVANCPSPTFDLPQGLAPEERMQRFCDALAEMGEPALADLATGYSALVKSQRFAPDSHIALLDQRSDALIEYFCQLALVHGVAFATEGAPPEAAAVDTALNHLRDRLVNARKAARRTVGSQD